MSISFVRETVRQTDRQYLLCITSNISKQKRYNLILSPLNLFCFTIDEYNSRIVYNSGGFIRSVWPFSLFAFSLSYQLWVFFPYLLIIYVCVIFSSSSRSPHLFCALYIGVVVHSFWETRSKFLLFFSQHNNMKKKQTIGLSVHTCQVFVCVFSVYFFVLYIYLRLCQSSF